MLKIEYNYNNVSEAYRHLARELNLTVKDSFFKDEAPDENGVLYNIKLPNDLQLMCMDYVPKDDVLFHRKIANKESYFIRIDGIASESENQKASVFFGSMRRESYYMATANKRNKNVSIFLSKEWLDKYFEEEEISDFLKKSVFIKKGSYHYEFLDTEYRRLTNEMMLIQADKSFEYFIIQNRVMLLLERFFSRLYKKSSDKNLFVKATAEQLERLRLAENQLIKDVSFPAPTIAQLAKISALSTTKLKSMFKEVYGLPVYQYFQKHRMQKAKAMLLSKKYSVRETASELGYINIKDFVKAFQKSFDQLPDEIAAKK